MRRVRTRLVSLAALLTLIAPAACRAQDPAPTTDDASAAAAPFAACPAPATGSPRVTPAGGQLVADLTLSCFTGGAPVALRGLGQPAVINLWASWCEPCRAELPEFQRLAGETGGRFLVLGVVTQNTRPAAASLGADAGVTFPNLYDESAALLHAVAGSGLPVTLFVDAGGVVRHVDRSGALDLPTLRTLVGRHLGVVLP